jgi:sec-independent protein translocase protein TatA
MPFSLGPTEMIFIMVLLLVLFGAKRLPELGSGLGKGIKEFKRSMKEINSEIERASSDDQQIAAPRRPAGAIPPQESETGTEKRG